MIDNLKLSMVSIFVIVFLVGCSKPTIEVRKQVGKDFRLPEEVQIVIINDDDSSINARGVGAMSWYFDEALNAIGVKESYDGNADTIIKCRIKYGPCVPYFGRHFDIHFTAITDVNIQIINQNDRVLGEAQFVGSLNRMPNMELIAKMIGQIFKTEIHILHSSINAKDINSVVIKHATKN